MNRCTPGYLLGQAAAQIIGALHTAHVAGPWALVKASTHNQSTTLEFAVGIVSPEQPDDRQRFRITLEEL